MATRTDDENGSADPGARQGIITFEEWRRNRGTYIGGSDAAAILGLSPWRTIGEVWIEKIRAQEASEAAGGDEQLDPEMTTRFTKWGRRLESVILDEYEEITGHALERPGLRLYRDPQFPFIGGTLDASATTAHGDKRIVEAKSTDAFVQWREQLWGPSGSDIVPDWYLVQLMHYLIVRQHEGFTMGDFAVLIGGNDFRVFHIAYDADLATMLIERLIEFWRLVETRTPPPFDYSHKGAVDLQKRIWNKVNPGAAITVPANYRVVPSGPTVMELLVEQLDAAEMKKIAEGRENAAKAALLHLAGNNAVVSIDGTPLAIKRTQKAGYHVDAYDVEPTIALEFSPRTTKKRGEILDEYRKQIPGAEKPALPVGGSGRLVGDGHGEGATEYPVVDDRD